MPPGDEKGLSKEILEQRRKIAEQSKRDKAEEKARLAKVGKNKKRNWMKCHQVMSMVLVMKYWHKEEKLKKIEKRQSNEKQKHFDDVMKN